MNELEKIQFDTNELNVILSALGIAEKRMESHQISPIFKQENEIYGSVRKDIIQVRKKIEKYWEKK